MGNASRFGNPAGARAASAADDGARFKLSERLQSGDGLWRAGNRRVALLPPYSPELNPIENHWYFLKSYYWSNRTYDDYEQLTVMVALS